MNFFSLLCYVPNKDIPNFVYQRWNNVQKKNTSLEKITKPHLHLPEMKGEIKNLYKLPHKRDIVGIYLINTSYRALTMAYTCFCVKIKILQGITPLRHWKKNLDVITGCRWNRPTNLTNHRAAWHIRNLQAALWLVNYAWSVKEAQLAVYFRYIYLVMCSQYFSWV